MLKPPFGEGALIKARSWKQQRRVFKIKFFVPLDKEILYLLLPLLTCS
jgi:hypothetical protein